MERKLNKKKLFIFVILPLLVIFVSILWFSFGNVHSAIDGSNSNTNLIDTNNEIINNNTFRHSI